MSDEAAAPPLTEERAKAILHSVGYGYLATHLDHRCSCNACSVCAATFLVKLQDRLTGPTIFVTGWQLGMNKLGVGKVLVQSGIGIGDAHRMVNQILDRFHRDSKDDNRFDDGLPIRIQVAEGVDRDSLIAQLRDNGVLID